MATRPVCIFMSNKSTDSLLKQMDILLDEKDLSTKSGLRFAFTVLREAVVTLSDMEERVKNSENAYVALSKSSSERVTQFDDVSKKVNIMWAGYKMLTWVASIFGVSVIALIWSLITGAATITSGMHP